MHFCIPGYPFFHSDFTRCRKSSNLDLLGEGVPTTEPVGEHKHFQKQKFFTDLREYSNRISWAGSFKYVLYWLTLARKRIQALIKPKRRMSPICIFIFLLSFLTVPRSKITRMSTFRKNPKRIQTLSKPKGGRRFIFLFSPSLSHDPRFKITPTSKISSEVTKTREELSILNPLPCLKQQPPLTPSDEETRFLRNLRIWFPRVIRILHLKSLSSQFQVPCS